MNPLFWLRRFLRRKRENKSEQLRQSKRAQSVQRMRSIGQRLSDVSPSATIDELIAVHHYHEVPIWWFEDGLGVGLLYSILLYTCRHQRLRANDAGELARMLLWGEVKMGDVDHKCRMAILGACERFPTQEVREILQEHLQFVSVQVGEERREHAGDIRFKSDHAVTKPPGGLASEFRRVSLLVVS